MKKRMFGLAVVLVVMASGIVSAGPIRSLVTSPGQCIGPNCCIGSGCVIPADPLADPFAVTASLHDNMRELWVEHNVWSRMVLMGVFESMKGCELYEDRVLQNVKEVQATLTPYYGDGAEKFGFLFERHLEIEDQILYAMKSDDQIFRPLVSDWYKNAEEISSLLYSFNPKVWNLDELNQMWRMHLDASLDQAFAYNKKDSQSEIKAFDFIQDHSMKMADYLSNGILKQFPTK